MLRDFRSYHVAVALYQECEQLKLRSHLKDQLLRASLSVALNLSEGSAKPSAVDRRRFYCISFASFREVQSILVVSQNDFLLQKYDHLGGMLYRLTRNSV